MRGLPRRPAILRLPAAGVVRWHYTPGALPRVEDEIGPNRFDDPRPNSADRYVVRYTASHLRGCLLESLDWLRPNEDAAKRELQVLDNADDPMVAPHGEPWAPIADFLRGRNVGVLTGHLRLLSINDPTVQADLDREPAVRAILDSPDGRAALVAHGRAHLDEAAVRLSTELGRDLTRACSLAIRDRSDRPDGIHHRSRHDAAEDCWALYDHAAVAVSTVEPFVPGNEAHRTALHSVASLWGLDLPPAWA